LENYGIFEDIGKGNAMIEWKIGVEWKKIREFV